jgi:diguanylate cyclase (GGDEF)-like protein
MTTELPANALHPTSVLAMGIVVAGTVSLIMAFFGASQRVYRGYWCWVAAMALATVGGVLHATRASWPGGIVLSNLVLMAWPILILAGLRRFFVRDRVLGSQRQDLLLLALGYLTWLSAWLSDAQALTRSFAYTVGAGGLQLWAAYVVLQLDNRRHSPALKVLTVVLLAQALLPVPKLVLMHLAGSDAATVHPSLAAPMVVVPLIVTSLVTMCLFLVLTHERTVRDLRETQRQLRVLADIDMLTQVPNRRHFEELAVALLGQAGHGKAQAVLMLFDIDHFKRINDSFGHAVGDAALRLVARCARETLRTRDVLGRIGGDEFMLLLPGASVDDALIVAERISRRIDAEPQSRERRISLSFGVVRIEPGEALESAQHRADLALYEAKRQGRARAVPAHLSHGNTVFGDSRPVGLQAT